MSTCHQAKAASHDAWFYGLLHTSSHPRTIGRGLSLTWWRRRLNSGTLTSKVGWELVQWGSWSSVYRGACQIVFLVHNSSTPLNKRLVKYNFKLSINIVLFKLPYCNVHSLRSFPLRILEWQNTSFGITHSRKRTRIVGRCSSWAWLSVVVGCMW